MVIAEVEVLDARTSGSTLGWQTLQRLKSLGPSPGPTSRLGRARRRLLRRVKRTDSSTSQRPFLIRHSVSVEDSMPDLLSGKGKLPALNGMQAFEMEKTPLGEPFAHDLLLHGLSASVKVTFTQAVAGAGVPTAPACTPSCYLDTQRPMKLTRLFSRAFWNTFSVGRCTGYFSMLPVGVWSCLLPAMVMTSWMALCRTTSSCRRWRPRKLITSSPRWDGRRRCACRHWLPTSSAALAASAELPWTHRCLRASWAPQTSHRSDTLLHPLCTHPVLSQKSCQ